MRLRANAGNSDLGSDFVTADDLDLCHKLMCVPIQLVATSSLPTSNQASLLLRASVKFLPCTFKDLEIQSAEPLDIESRGGGCLKPKSAVGAQITLAATWGSLK